MSKQKVMIAVIAFDGIVPGTTQAFFKAFYELGKRFSDKYEFFIMVTEKREQHRARNVIIESALGLECDYIWQIDDDTILNANTFEVLMKGLDDNPDAGVIGALYVQRNTPFHAVVMTGGMLKRGGWFTEYIPPHLLTRDVMDVAVTGGGCMLFRSEPFTKMMKPYFFSDVEIGTDVQICLRLKEMGYKVLCHTGHEVGHIGERQIFYPSSVPSYMGLFNEERRKVFDDACEFLSCKIIDIYDTVARSDGVLVNEWYEKKRETEEEIRDYYTTPAHGDYFVARGVWYNLCGDHGVSYNVDLSSALGLGIFEGPALDFGCGIGVQTQLLSAHGIEVDAVDLPTKTLEFVKMRMNGELQATEKRKVNVMTTEEFWYNDDLSPKTYKTIVMMDVLEHLKEPREVFQRLMKMLEPEGKLVTNALSDDFKGEESGVPQHLKILTRNEILALFQEEGLEPTGHDTIYIKRSEDGNHKNLE